MSKPRLADTAMPVSRKIVPNVAEVTVTRALIGRYRDNLRLYCQQLKDYCTRRGIAYLFTGTEVPFDQIALTYFRQRGLLK